MPQSKQPFFGTNFPMIRVLISLLIFNLGMLPDLKSQEKKEDQITSLQFFGNSNISSSKLMPFFDFPLTYPSEKFNESLLKLSNYYMDRGYIDFFIEECKLLGSLDNNQQKLEIYVREGQKYEINKLEILGNTSQSTNELKARLTSQVGMIYNKETLEEDIDELLTQYENTGYPFVKIVPHFQSDTSHHESSPNISRVSIKLQIQEGPYVTISNYQIFGNMHTEDQVIIRETGLFKGEPFNGELFSEIQDNLNNLGFFKDVQKPELLIISDQNGNHADSLDGIIHLEITEGNPNMFDGIVGYQPSSNDEDGYFTGYVNFLLKNMFGTGRKLQVEWIKSDELTQDVKLKYMEPWIFGVPIDATLNFQQLKQDSTYTKFYLGLKFSYQITKRFSISVIGSKEAVNPIGNPETDETVNILNSSTLITGFGLEYDTRDFVQNPRRGFLFRNEYLFGSKSFSASDSLISHYGLSKNLSQQYILMDSEFYTKTFSSLILALGIHAKALISDYIDPGDWFRFGGAQSLRGYREQQFAASQYIYSNLEYRYLLSKLAFLFVFFDSGYYYRAVNPFNTEDKELYDVKTGYGFGIRIESPLGLLKISYALGQGTTWNNGMVHVGLINEF